MATRRTTRGTAAGGWMVATLLAAVLGGAAPPASAVSLFLAPATVAPEPGSPFAVELLVAGLDTPGADVLGAFDVTLGFDSTAIAVSSVSFDGFLGAIPADATAAITSGIGTLALAEFSILPAATLDALQPASFRLATIVFEATSAAPSAIDVTAALLGDGDGAPIPLATPPGGTQVRPIPEPAAALVFGLGVAVAAHVSRRRPRAG